MYKDGWYFFGTFQAFINWCERGKKFAVFIETDAKKSELVFQAVKGIRNNFRAF